MHFSTNADLSYVVSILIPLILFALFAFLLNTISYSRLLAAHMLVYIFASLCIPSIPDYMAIDILLFTGVGLAITKGIEALLEGGGKRGRSAGWVMMIGFCGVLVMESVVREGKGWDFLGREFSFVIGNLRRWLV